MSYSSRMAFLVQPARLAPHEVFESAKLRVKSFAEDNAKLLNARWTVDMTGPGTLFAQRVAKAGGRVEAVYKGVEIDGDFFGAQKGRPRRMSSLAKHVGGVYSRDSFNSGDAVASRIAKTGWGRLAAKSGRIYILQMRHDPRAGVEEVLHFAEEYGVLVVFVVPDCFVTVEQPAPPLPHGTISPSAISYNPQLTVYSDRLPPGRVTLAVYRSAAPGGPCIREVM